MASQSCVEAVEAKLRDNGELAIECPRDRMHCGLHDTILINSQRLSGTGQLASLEVLMGCHPLCVALRWLSGRRTGQHPCPKREAQPLQHVAGRHVRGPPLRQLPTLDQSIPSRIRLLFQNVLPTTFVLTPHARPSGTQPIITTTDLDNPYQDQDDDLALW